MQHLQSRRVTQLGFILYGVFFLFAHLVLSDDQPSVAALTLHVLQILLLPAGILWPRASALLFACAQVGLAGWDLGVGYTAFVGLAFVAVLGAKRQVVASILVAACIIVTLFFDPGQGIREVPVTAVLLNIVIYVIAIGSGIWIGKSIEERGKLRAAATARRAELQEVLHESVAAGLSGVVARLQVLALRAGKSRPDLRDELDDIADMVRGVTANVRLLLEAETQEAARSSGSQVVSAPVALSLMKTQLEQCGFTVDYATNLAPVVGSTPRSAEIGRIVREMTTNVTKYGDREVPVRIQAVETNCDIQIEVVNGILAGRRGADSTGLGLQSVTQLAEKVGGEFEFSRTGNHYRSALSVPKEEAE
ncbi:sensor histidine kinase [Corynebacterium nasicanis]|uniref:Sensor histidine kinase n=1 Tax=Corynebacterium nasicanis TaxID=1448267 RepID=A0ABW1QFF7_9CORY